MLYAHDVGPDHTDQPYHSYRASQQHIHGQIYAHDWLHGVFQLLNCHGLYPFGRLQQFQLERVHLYLFFSKKRAPDFNKKKTSNSNHHRKTKEIGA
ncbi:hypothetical protein PITC_008200 [Penicillium italicum]|uniref:Uncharacterized protein n=1 Tax=Penicillium italicum TaxID=40296 RepID=A0A0A2KDA9_PENIT|nr:hypothetical protein PITC_008200 [Penicillium italicum]